MAIAQGGKPGTRKRLAAHSTTDARIPPDPDRNLLKVQTPSMASNATGCALLPSISHFNETHTVFSGTGRRITCQGGI